jgi:hypothetical protein
VSWSRRLANSTQAPLRDGRRDIDLDCRLVARTAAHHHRAASRTSTDAGEPRIRRAQAPGSGGHRPTSARPTEAGAPQPAPHGAARRRLLPRLGVAPPSDPGPGPDRRHPARARLPWRRRARRLACPPRRPRHAPQFIAHSPCPSSWSPPCRSTGPPSSASGCWSAPHGRTRRIWSSSSPTAGRSIRRPTTTSGRACSARAASATCACTTGATQPPPCCAARASTRVVMALLGHSQVCTTMDIYSHVVPSLAREAADRMGTLPLPSRGGRTATTTATGDDAGRPPGGERPGRTGGAEGTRTPDHHTARPS